MIGILKFPWILWGIIFKNYSGAQNEEVSLIPLIVFPLIFLKGPKLYWKWPLLVALALPTLFWLVTSQQLRLISAVIGLGSLLLGVGYQKSLSLWPSYARSSNLIICMLLWICAFYLLQGLIQQPNPFAQFMGFQSREQFLINVLRPDGYVPVSKFLNENLPQDARVLILGQQNGYYLDRISAYDFDYTYPILKKWSENSRTPEMLYLQFKKNGFTHILYNANGMMGSAIRANELGMDRYPWRPGELKNYEQFFLKYTKRISLPYGGGYSLYSIEPRSGFSILPDFLPGTELLYLKEMKSLMGIPKLVNIVGKPISSTIYLNAYANVLKQNASWDCHASNGVLPTWFKMGIQYQKF